MQAVTGNNKYTNDGLKLTLNATVYNIQSITNNHTTDTISAIAACLMDS